MKITISPAKTRIRRGFISPGLEISSDGGGSTAEKRTVCPRKSSFTGRTIIHSHFHGGGHRPASSKRASYGCTRGSTRTPISVAYPRKFVGREERARAQQSANNVAAGRTVLNLTPLTPFRALMTHRAVQLGLRPNRGEIRARISAENAARPYVAWA